MDIYLLCNTLRKYGFVNFSNAIFYELPTGVICECFEKDLQKLKEVGYSTLTEESSC